MRERRTEQSREGLRRFAGCSSVSSERQHAAGKTGESNAGRVTIHLIGGSQEEIEKTLKRSLDAFFEMYPEI